MTQREKKQKRLIILGLGLTFTLLVLGGAWLWMDRENMAWRADDAKFAKYRELYATWDKTCPDGLDTNPNLRAGLALAQPDALLCRFEQVSGAEDWPDGALEHRIAIASLAAKLYVATHDDKWLTHRPCTDPLPFDRTRDYASDVNEDLFPAFNRQGQLQQLPYIFVSIPHEFFDCNITDEYIRNRDYVYQ